MLAAHPRDTLWQRSRKKLPFLRNISKSKESLAPRGDDVDAAKAAHARRREQVRRAQRNHRERKESYIKSLEKEFKDLRGVEVSTAMQTQKVADENKALREIMLAHGIPLPETKQPQHQQQQLPQPMRPDQTDQPPVVVSVVGEPGPHQCLQVSVNGGPKDVPRILPEELEASKVRNGTPISPHTNGSPATTNGTSLSPEPPRKHPLGLDATQVGVDFVLYLERHCLQHARTTCTKAPFSGHSLTFQTPLLTNGPETLHHNCTWEIPAGQLDRLFELAGALNLDGEVTPVQAWNRVKAHPDFHKLDAPRLQNLAAALAEEVQCYGFGAVVDEEMFNLIIEYTFNNL